MSESYALNDMERGHLCSTTIQCMSGLLGDLEYFPGLLHKIIQERAWERRIHLGRVIELKSLRELITEKPIQGWGSTPEKVEALIAGHPDVEIAYRREMVEAPGKRAKVEADISDIVTNKPTPERGNSRSYTLDRLERERPDLLEEVKAKRLSANAAAIQAGFRKTPTGLDILLKGWSKATPEERAQFLEAIKG
jgi:hypothetical protein